MALTAGKAKKMLEDGTVHGRALTDKQKKYFGAIAGGATPMKKINGGWLDKYQDGGDVVMYGTPEYEAAYKEGRFRDVPNVLDEVVISNIDYDKYPYYDDLSEQDKKYFNDPGPIGRAIRRRAYTKRGLAEDTKDMVTSMLVKQPLSAIQAPQSVLVEGLEAIRGNDANLFNALTYDTQRYPSQVLNIENPVGAIALDIATDPTTYIGAGLFKKSLMGPFTNALKSKPNMYYRGLGQSGLDDALKSGVLRAKPADQIAPAMAGPFDMAKRFNNLYVSPRLNVANQYGKGIVAEIPSDASNFFRRYKGSDWSMATTQNIPIDQVNLYKKNIFGNYRPIDASVDAAAPSFKQSLLNDINSIKRGAANLTNPLSDFRVSLTQLKETLKGGKFRSPFRGYNQNPTTEAADFTKKWMSAPGYLKRFDEFTFQFNDPALTRQVRNAQNLYNRGLEQLRRKQPDLFTPSGELTVPLSTIQKTFPRLADDAMLLKRLNEEIIEGANKIRYANNARMNAGQLSSTGKFTKVMTPTSADDIKYFADNPNTLGFFRAPENRALISIPRFESSYKNLSKRNWKLGRTITHENKHATDAGARATRPEYARTIQSAVPQVTDDYAKVITGKNMEDIKKVYGDIKKLGDDAAETIEYLSSPQEVAARIDELRMDYIPKKFWGTDKQYEVSDELIKRIIADGKAGKSSVSPRFFKMIQDEKAFKNLFKTLPAVAAPIAIGVPQMQDGGRCWPGYKTVPGKTPFSKGSCTKAKDGAWLDKYEVIEDDMGQLTNPGKITKINSNNITMKGVDFPVLGISDTGDKKMMLPGKDYKFDGKSVTEYPMAQFGFDFSADGVKKFMGT